MYIGMLLSLVIAVPATIQGRKAFEYKQNFQYNPSEFDPSIFEAKYRRAFMYYGVTSGLFFMAIAVLMIVVLRRLLRLIDNETNLSQAVRQQRSGLRLMLIFVVISYMGNGLVNLGMGHYELVLNTYWRWICYPLLTILLNMPNVLLIYIVHRSTYSNPESAPRNSGDRHLEESSMWQSEDWTDTLHDSNENLGGSRASQSLESSVNHGFMKVFCEESHFHFEYERISQSHIKEQHLLEDQSQLSGQIDFLAQIQEKSKKSSEGPKGDSSPLKDMLFKRK